MRLELVRKKIQHTADKPTARSQGLVGTEPLVMQGIHCPCEDLFSSLILDTNRREQAPECKLLLPRPYCREPPSRA